MLENIAYNDYTKKSDIHGTVLYPAVMIAPVQKEILETLISQDEIHTVFDPFHGSGTSLYETAKIDPTIKLVGCDINPLANLITTVKLQGVTDLVYDDIQSIKKFIDKPGTLDTYNFPNINKWFRNDIQESLTLLRSAILEISNRQNRLFFWYMLCNILRKYSNTRTSTYKLHVKTEEMINKISNNVIDDYLGSIEKNVHKFTILSNDFELYKYDILKLLPALNSNFFDISITSPPYGDNKTTVPYGQFSMLALYTIPPTDLSLEGWELNSFSTIDSKSLGNMSNKMHFSSLEEELLKPYLKQISIAKHSKIKHFFYDYFSFLRDLSRVTKKYIVLTLGNRTVDRVQIDLTGITESYLTQLGFIVLQSASRDIAKKRTPKLTSKVDDSPVNSMTKEYVTIYKKI